VVALPQRQPVVWTHGASICGVHIQGCVRDGLRGADGWHMVADAYYPAMAISTNGHEPAVGAVEHAAMQAAVAVGVPPAGPSAASQWLS
jgi:hypothetical protein